MPRPRYSADEATRLGEGIYERSIRSRVEEGNKGKYLVIDIETGDYEIGDDYQALSHRMLARKPDAMLYVMRIGYSAGRIGGRFAGAQR